jgi:putative ABC transport system permease protein
MPHLLSDFKFGLRMLRKHPGHTLAAAVALGLGIGLTTATFSIVDGVLLKGLPFEHAERIVHLEGENPQRGLNGVEADFQDFLDWRRRQHSFEGLAAFNATTVNLASTGARPERVDGAHVSANTFALLRVKPLMGRLFLPGEDAPGAEPVAVLGYGLWHSRFGGDLHVLGKMLRVNGVNSVVVGVMPPRFAFPLTATVWAPLQLDPAKSPRGKEGVGVFGRLKEGVSLEQAQAEMSGIARALEREFPQANRGLGTVVKPFVDEYVNEQARGLLYSMLGAVGLVLLLACSNVASLTMARASQRTRELAIRSALGAGRARVLGQILIETLLLAAIGSLLGLGLARWGVALFNGTLASSIDNRPPFWIQIAVDPRALAFALGATLTAALVSGLVPALQASRADAGEVLKDEGRGSTSLRLGRFSRAVVALEVAFSCAALVGAGLMIKSVVEIQKMDFGFEQKNLLTYRIALYQADYPEQEDRVALWEKLLPRLEALSGVESVAAVSTLPGLGADGQVYAVEGKAYATEQDMPSGNAVSVSPGYFHIFNVRPLEGRVFDAGDLAGSLPVVLVNHSFAVHAWPGQSALGKRLRVGLGEEARWRTVVGVMPDSHLQGLDPRGKEDGFLLPLAQACPPRVSVALRTRGNPLDLVPAARDQVAALDGNLPIYFVKTMEKALADNSFFFRLFGGIFSLFGLVALVLGGVGIYGVVAFSVQQRTQEIGVRMALGAGTGNVLGMILKQGVRQLLVGLGVGLPIAALLGQGLSSILFGVKPSDPPTFLAVAFLLAAVSLLACLIPARRAAAVDPVVAIRYD